MKKNGHGIRAAALVLLSGVLFGAAACGEKKPKQKETAAEAGTGFLTAVSDTGVEVLAPAEPMETDKQVGVFYFILHGTGNGNQNYDNTEILKKIDLTGKEAVSPEEWRAAGGGAKGMTHWWGQPLFGYYDAMDEWVITRHVEMLTDAGVDFIVVDQTNGVLDGYIKRINLLFETLYKFRQQGRHVPQVAMMCYDDGPNTVDKLYVQFYAKHPEYAELFYHWNGHEKPVIFDNISSYNKTASGTIDTEKKLASYSEGARDFFEFRDVAFPHETTHEDFKEPSLIYLDCRETPQPVTDPADNGYSYYCVALAEIRTGRSTTQWFSDSVDHSRNYDGTVNRQWAGEKDAYLYGYNFAREFEDAIRQDVDMVFVTGWNEWSAALNTRDHDKAISFVDNADINNSRDIEPMTGGYGDNYYMQLCDFISRFKYGTIRTAEQEAVTIDAAGDFAQWDAENILTFTDFAEDGAARDCKSAAETATVYREAASVNDFTKIKAASDASFLYFYAETAEPIRELSADGTMTLFLKTGSGTGYDYAVNRKGGGAMTLEKRTETGDWAAQEQVPYKTEGNKLMLKIPKKALGLSEGAVRISFKWADGVQEDGTALAFYKGGDAAPYGRLNYLYCGK